MASTSGDLKGKSKEDVEKGDGWICSMLEGVMMIYTDRIVAIIARAVYWVHYSAVCCRRNRAKRVKIITVDIFINRV